MILGEFFSPESSVRIEDNLTIEQYSYDLQVDEFISDDWTNQKYEVITESYDNESEKIPWLKPGANPKDYSISTYTVSTNHVMFDHNNVEKSSLFSQSYQEIDQYSFVVNNLPLPVNSWHLTSKYLTFSPISIHIDYPDANNFPLGLGAAYDFDIKNPNYGFLNTFLENSVVSLEFNIFRESAFGYPSTYVGLSLRKNIFDTPIQIGSAIGLLYTTQLQELSGSPVLPFVLPFLQTDFDSPINLRVIYVPSLADWNSQQLFFTLLVKFN